MTQANAISQLIISEAKSAAATTLQTASQKAKQQHLALEEEIKAKKAQAQADFEQVKITQLQRAQKINDLEIKKEQLFKKRELIQKAFQGALEALCAMSDDDKREFNKKNLSLVASKGQTVQIAENEARILTQEFFDQFGLVLSPEFAPISGGCLVIGQGISYNCSYEAIVNQSKDALELEVARILFEE